MSLAMTAQSIENTDNNNNSDNYIINRKKSNSNSKTQKRMPSTFGDIDHSKVQNVLNSIYRNLGDDSDNNLGDYKPRSTSAPVNTPYAPINPLAPPASMRQKQEQGKGDTQGKEGMSNYDYNADDVDNYSSKFVPQPAQNDSMDLQDLQDVYMNNEQVKRYFKNLVPNFQSPSPNQTVANQTGIQTSGNKSSTSGHTSGHTSGPMQSYNSNMSDTNHVLIDKLNYMINLLEEQQDERTNNVTEEVILYSFLGVFIIFVVDGFARVTRYTR
jgi:hypothetical protein